MIHTTQSNEKIIVSRNMKAFISMLEEEVLSPLSDLSTGHDYNMTQSLIDKGIITVVELEKIAYFVLVDHCEIN